MGPHSSSSAKAKAKNEFAAVLERKEPAQVVKSHQTARDPGSSSSFTTAASNKSSRTEFCCACPWTGAARSLHLGKLPCPKPFLLQSLIWVGGGPSPASTGRIPGAPRGRADGVTAQKLKTALPLVFTFSGFGIRLCLLLLELEELIFAKDL